MNFSEKGGLKLKVILINGSRKENGCTYSYLSEVASVLKKEGINSEIINIGTKVLNGEMDALLAQVMEAMEKADGLIVGSPVYFASPTGELIAFLDRLFMKGSSVLRFKPAAALTSARRAGTTATIDALNKYFLYSQMPIVSTRYWNMIFGNSPEELAQDEEGMQIVRTLATNMAWVLKSIEAGKAAGVKQPVAEPRTGTNFIR